MNSLSICIPTYNRVKYLKKNVDIIIAQIRQINYFNIEICIADNFSDDSTEITVKKIIDNNKDITIKYKKNDSNLGADRNFITAMNMASNEYSILWGDDDFFKEGALEFIVNLIGENQEISIFFSNRDLVDGFGNFIKNQIFVRNDIKSFLIDFSKEEQVRSYFALSRSIACLLSFISSVIYKTKIIYEREFDKSFIGTQYAFLFFWWHHLMDGNKMLYTNISYINCTVRVPGWVAKGTEAILYDYKGFILVANKIFHNSSLRLDFLKVINYGHDLIQLRNTLIIKRKMFLNELYPRLIECDWNKDLLKKLIKENSIKYLFKNIIAQLIPPFLLRYIIDLKTKRRFKTFV
jgi:abequosyltransferase